jgi:transcriptional regulator with XRE-family HTH domain
VSSIKPHVIVGKNIARLRTSNGFTQEKLIEKLGIDRRSLQRIESGEWNMTVDYLDRIRKALKCSWKDLFDRMD